MFGLEDETLYELEKAEGCLAGLNIEKFLLWANYSDPATLIQFCAERSSQGEKKMNRNELTKKANSGCSHCLYAYRSAGDIHCKLQPHDHKTELQQEICAWLGASGRTSMIDSGCPGFKRYQGGYGSILRSMVNELWQHWWEDVDIDPSKEATCARDMWDLIPEDLKGDLNESLTYK